MLAHIRLNPRFVLIHGFVYSYRGFKRGVGHPSQGSGKSSTRCSRSTRLIGKGAKLNDQDLSNAKG